MANSLIGGLIADSGPENHILVSDPDTQKLGHLQKKFSINTTSSNLDTLEYEVIILAIKPQQLQAVCRQIAPELQKKARHKPLFISIAAGVRSEDIGRWLGGDQAIVRCMPNTPALLQCGATALYKNNETSDDQAELAETILNAVGITAWVSEETQLDAVTALSGSGPAYFFLMMEAMQAAGKDLGLDETTARSLTLQTALGAAQMATSSTDELVELRQRVTSKGGTTESAIQSFEDHNFRQIVKTAMQEACKKSKILGDELSKND